MFSMKKVIAFVLTLLCIFTLGGCIDGRNAGNNSLYAQGLEIVQLMSEMARNEEYLEGYGWYISDFDETNAIASADYSIPSAVYSISIPDTNHIFAAMAGSSNLLDEASDELKALLAHRILSSLIVNINGHGSDGALVVATVLTAEKNFVNKNVTNDVIYLYTFKDAYPIAVIFNVGEDHAISATGQFVLGDDTLTSGSADEIESYLRDFYEIPVDVSQIFPRKGSNGILGFIT